MKNPFIVGRPITDSKNFFDRETELEEIFSAIKNRYNISLVGERKIGKTSLLNMVRDPDKMKEHGIEPEKTCIVSIDSSEIKKGNPDSVWRFLLSLLCEEIEDETIKKELNRKCAANSTGFSDVIKTLSHIKKDVVLILDEFEAICEGMDIDFFQNLRHLAQVSRLTYLVSTSRDLFTLTTESKQIVSSPFFNIFSPLFLGLFQKHQSKEFIKSKFNKMNITEEQINSILRICGPHPFFLQLFCSLLFRSFPDKELDLSSNEGIDYFKKGVEQAKMNFNLSSNNHFEYFWEKFNQKERDTLSAIAVKKISHTFERILKDMERRGFLTKDNQKYEIFSETFQKWIVEHTEKMEPAKREEKPSFIIVMAILTFSVSLILFLSMFEDFEFLWNYIHYIFIAVFIIGLFFLLRRGSE